MFHLLFAVLAVVALGPNAASAGSAGTESYTYDALGRLVTIASPDGTGSTYQYDAAGNRQAISTGADVTKPGAPSVLTAAAASSTTVNLAWHMSSDTGGSGLVGYNIYRNGSTTKLGSSAVLTYSDTTTVGATAYTYIVKAYDGAGNESLPSNTASVTTPATPIGTFQFVSGAHAARGAMGDVGIATIKNSGTATITVISYSCTGGNWAKVGTSPTSLAPGASGLFECKSNMAGQQTVSVTLVGTGASNSPFSPAPW